MSRTVLAGALLTIAVFAVAYRAAAEDESVRCGAPGKPPCPLQHWMRERVAAPVGTKDLAALAEALEAVRLLNPRPKKWGNWDVIAREGAKAARDGKLRRAKAACGRCHGVYRRQYRFEYRTRPIPEELR